jgi:hypothetical protein
MGKPVKTKPSKGLEPLEGGYTVEYDSCYRGRIEIHRDKKTGEVVKFQIIR